MTNLWILLTLIATASFVVAAVIGTYRWLTARSDTASVFDRSLAGASSGISELATTTTTPLPPTYQHWLTMWEAAGKTPSNPRTPGHIAISVAVTGALIGITVFPGGAAGIILTPITVTAYWFYLSHIAHKRVNLMEKQLPLLLSSIRAQLSAGVPPQTALIEVADSIPQPLGAEVRIIKSELTTGIPLNTALRHFATRVPTRQIQFLVASMEIAVASGSDLNPQLIVIEDIYEQRTRIAGKIKSALALVRPTAWMAEAAPLLALAYNLSNDPTAASFYFGNGLVIFLAGCALYAAGIFTVHSMMRRLTSAGM